jgi:single stranded DNA-binding protein
MSGFQSVTIVGNLGGDPDTRLVNDSPVSNFSVAVNDLKDKPPTWYRVAAWNKLGTAAGEYLRKGSKVMVIGRPELQVYTKDGVEKTSLSVRASTITFLDTKKTDEQGTGSGSRNNNDDDVAF